MNLKTIIATLSIIASLTVTPINAFAQTANSVQVNQQDLSFLQNLYTQLKNFESQNPQYVRRNGIVITGINGSTITGTQTNKKKGITTSFTINAGSATFVKRFWGQSSLSQEGVGDRIRVIGTWTNSSKTTINAFIIRDMSIQDRADRFSGKVSAIGSNDSFTFQSLHRGSWTINISSSTKLTGRKNTPLQFSNIQVNDTLRISGMFNRSNKVISANVIRDMSYPQNNPSPTQ